MNTNRWTLLALSLLTTTTLLSASQQRPLMAQSPPPRVITLPAVSEGITVRLENQTPEAITYEVLGDTQPRVLASGDDVMLQDLNIPATLTFFYADIQKDRQTGEGLLKATLGVDDVSGTLDILVTPTTLLGEDVSNITIEPNGDVFVF